MKTSFALTYCSAVLCCTPAFGVVTFEWVTIGNPGNAPDPETGFGTVDYTYRISKHEVTNAQYVEFLNAVDPTGADPLGLYNPSTSSDVHGGILLSEGGADGANYETKPGRDKNPVVFVSFFDAMRFVNWVANGQGSGSTESGAYTLGGGTDETRNPNASHFLPSEDEWYKAAYYDPRNNVYYDYPTGSDTAPYSDTPSGLNTPDNTNVANFFKDDGVANGYDDGYAATGSADFASDQNYLTDVGAYSKAVSPYGTLDQGRNVWEWNEAVPRSTVRGTRGGYWGGFSHYLYAPNPDVNVPGFEAQRVGFRVASRVPEPATHLLGASAVCGLPLRRRR